MIKKLLFSFFMILCAFSNAQSIKIGSGVLGLNKKSQQKHSSMNVTLGQNEVLQKVMRFDKIPNKRERNALEQRGITLLNYIQDKMYYVSVKQESAQQLSAHSKMGNVNVVGVYNVSPLWKIDQQVYEKNVPEWAQVEGVNAFSDKAKLRIEYYKYENPKNVEKALKNVGAEIIHTAERFYQITAIVDLNRVVKFAENPFVKWITYIAPPAKIFNNRARAISGAELLNRSSVLGGRGLDGEGMLVGIWDGSIENHPDLTNRKEHTYEFSYMSSHGQHVSGTMLGAGILDPRAKGMAPKAKFVASNFMKSNGKTVEQEMWEAVTDYNMSVTQNSYGVPVKSFCGKASQTYSGSGDVNLDQLVEKFPTLLHVFAAGNDQTSCLKITGSRYYTSTRRAKNVLIIGATNRNGVISSFSSWGPMDDGRILPHVATFGGDFSNEDGSQVYSTSYSNGYEYMSGTSMATPVASGNMTLVYQRYRQLHGKDPLTSLAKAAFLNTASDKGNPQVDYTYGYGLANSLKTVELLENNQYVIGKIQQGQTKQHSITVPEGVRELKVMLCWTDKAGNQNKKALINDLDLTVNDVLPWVLDKDNPSANAVRSFDRVNNQEQVTFDNPVAGIYNVKVKGYEIPEGVQQYSLVWHFVKDEITVVYPNGGEVISPSDKITIMWQSDGFEGNQTVEVSYDGGTTYELLADNIPDNLNSYNFVIPDNVTGNAMVRITQNGTSDESDHTFTIMGRPKKLRLRDAGNCSNDNVLEWDAVANASKYKVLSFDEETKEFSVIGEVTENSYTLKSSDINYDKRNIYTVKAVSGNNLESERAKGIVANLSKPLDLQSVTLPFEEKMMQYPSKYFKFYGEDVAVQPKSNATILGDPEYRFIEFMRALPSAYGVKKSWNEGGDVFESNPQAISNFKICQFDATSYAGKKIWLRIIGFLDIPQTSTDGVAQFRVLVDGKPVENTYGQKVVKKIEAGKNIMYWDLTDVASGKNVSINVQSITRNRDFYSEEVDKVTLGYFKIFEPKQDASISLILPEKSKNLTANETISVKVMNKSSEPLTNVPVSYKINSQTVVSEVVPGPIEPMKSVTYNFAQKANFTQKDIKFEVTAKVSLPSDVNPDNDESVKVTTRFGDYHVMPEKGISNTIVATSTPKGFTDPGGKALDYEDGLMSSVVIKPQTQGKKVKLTIHNFDSESNNDGIIIREGNTSRGKVIAILTGKHQDLEFISTAEFGEFYIQFITTDNDKVGSGWFAEVVEVDDPSKDPANIFNVSSYIYEGDYTAGKNVRIKVENKSSKEKTNVKIRFRKDNDSWIEETIPSIPANNFITYTTNAKITAPAGTTFNFEVEVLETDSYMDDNYDISEGVSSDYYCFSSQKYIGWGSTYKPIFFSKIAKDDVFKKTSETDAEGGKPQYFRDVKFKLYKDITDNIIKVTLGKSKDNGKISFWVDWNKNRKFDETPVVVSTTVNQTEYDIVVPSSDIKSASAGEYFVRFRVMDDGSSDPCSSSYTAYGEVEDYAIEVIENYPVQKDLAVTATNLVDGEGMTNQETVKVTIENKTPNEVSNFEVSYAINGGTSVKETVTQIIPAFGSLEYTFNTPADLSVGKGYEFKFNVNLIGDENPENNVFIKNIINQILKDGFYALNFDGVDDVLNLGTLNNANLKTSTYEMWIAPETYGSYGKIGFGRLFDGKNAIIFLHGEGNQNYKDHSLVVAVGGVTYNTSLNSVALKKWQHIAVSIEGTTGAVKVYIDGVEQALTDNGKTFTSFEDNTDKELFVGNNAGNTRQFEGLIDHIRIWNSVRSVDEIQTNMHKSASGSNLIAEFRIKEGEFNKYVYSNSGTLKGVIKNADISDDKNTSIWQKVVPKFSSYDIDDKVVDFTKVDYNHIKTELQLGKDITQVIATFEPNMKNTTVTVSGTQQTSGVTSNDFTNSEATPITYTLNATHIGHNISGEFKVTVIQEAKTDCDLVSFEIPSLNISANPIKASMQFEVPDDTDVTNLITNFKVSDGATVSIDEQNFINGTGLDFTKPVAIKVLAENGRTYKIYTISLVKKQTIDWNPTTTTKTYGDPKFDLGGTSSSGENVVYESSNESVLKIEYNKAVVKGVGTATITAYCPKTNTLLDATPVAKEYTVNKATLNVTADDKQIDVSDAMPELTKTYAGFVYGEDKSVLTTEPTLSTTVTNTNTAGTYPIELAGGSAKNYELDLNNGTLTIRNVKIYTLTFVVTDGTNPISGAIITVKGADYTTNAEGKVEVKSKEDSVTYNYTVKKTGKEDVSGSFVFDGNKTIDITMVPTLPMYTLIYNVDSSQGLISSGTSPQQVKKGTDGTAVEVTPNVGLQFKQWSDGVTDNPRIDTNVQGDITVSAEFEKKEYTVKFVADTTRGNVEGDAVQKVKHNEPTTQVNAVAKQGYVFYQWSDGVADNPRIIGKVIANMELTAIFEKVYELPYTQDFETAGGADGKTPPVDWRNISNNGNDMVWMFKNPADKSFSPSYCNPSEMFDPDTGNATGTVAVINSCAYGYSGKQNADLISPIFDLTNYTDVKLSFLHKFKRYGSSEQKAILSYSIDGGKTWVELQNFPQSGYSAEKYEKVISAVEGKAKVRFKWHYEAMAADYWMVDNIKIEGERSATPKFTLTYTAGVGGIIEGITPQEVEKGASGTVVEAKADIGYKFVQWSDGKTDNPRIDINVSADIEVTAKFSKIEAVKYTVTYEAGLNGRIVGVSVQELAEGLTTTEVKAVAKSGYRFMKWSDGKTEASRTDVVTDNVTYEAIFEKELTKTTIIVGKAITPNGDGKNDVWLIEGNTTFVKCSVELYTRSGKLVYKSDDYKNDFDGTVSDGKLPGGSYISVVKIESLNKVITDWLYINF